MNLAETIIASLEAEVGELEYVKSSRSYNSPCPLCGGDDRFGYTPDPSKYPGASANGGLFNCRKCNYRGNGKMLLDHLKKGTNNYMPITNNQKSPKIIPANQFQAPDEAWRQAYHSFLMTRAYFLSEKNIPSILDRGISPATAKRYGIVPIGQYFESPYSAPSQTSPVTRYSPGILIPARRNGTLFKVELRNYDPDAKAKYIIMPGSSLHPMIFNDQTNGSGNYVIIESLLDGYMLHSQVPDLITPIALGSTTTPLDQDVVTLLNQARKILICLDNDQSGWERARHLRDQFPSSTVIIPPYGKDPGEYFQRGGDLREWLQSELSSSDSGEIKTQSIKIKVCKTNETLQECLQQIQNADQPVAMAVKTGPPGFGFVSQSGNIQANQIEYLAFYFGTNQVIILDLSKISLKQLKPILNEKLIVFDGIDTLSHLNQGQSLLGNIHSLLLMDNALRNKPIKPSTDLDSLAYLVGRRPGKKPSNRDETIISLARQSQLIHELYGYFQNQLEAANKITLYSLMRSAQPAISQIRSTGFFYKKGRKGDNYKQYLNPLNGRIVNNTQISGTITGRFTSSAPSLHNVPKDKTTRSRFLAPEGSSFIIGDFSQIQLRIIAELSADPALKEVFAQGRDLHLATAAAISNLPEEQARSYRSIAKAVNFGIVFGQTAKGLQDSLKKQDIEASLEQAQAYQNAFFELYPGVKQWIEQSQAGQSGHWKAVSPMGRVRELGWHARYKCRELINTPVQAAEAEILLATLALLPDLLEPTQTKLIHTVHDEIILECLDSALGQAQEALITAMTQGFLTIFPEATTNNLVDVTIQKNWWKDTTNNKKSKNQ